MICTRNDMFMKNMKITWLESRSPLGGDSKVCGVFQTVVVSIPSTASTNYCTVYWPPPPTPDTVIASYLAGIAPFTPAQYWTWVFLKYYCAGPGRKLDQTYLKISRPLWLLTWTNSILAEKRLLLLTDFITFEEFNAENSVNVRF